MLQPENQSKKYDALFADIDVGRTKIPMFQRDFVWGKEQSAKLIDSIIKGFPIGTFILWKTREELRSVRNIGNIALPESPKGDSVVYILDGQQRITSLYAVRKGCAGYLAHPPDFLRFLAEISSDDSPFRSRVGSVYFIYTHWEHLDDRF